MCSHAAVLILALAVIGSVAVAVRPATAADGDCQDALVTRVRAELAVFTGWLDRHGVDGVVGEVGWPDDVSGDADEWNALASAWFDDATVAGVSVTAWATGEWWGTTYPLSIYEDREAPAGVDSSNTQAPVLEAQAAPGINVAGAEFGTPGPLDTYSSFSNANAGLPGDAYHYDGQATFDHLAARGIATVRIPFRWERIQPILHSSLNGNELQRLRDAVDRAQGAGLTVAIDVHNYGAYWLHDADLDTGVRRAIGSTEVPVTAFADLWGRLAVRFADEPDVVLGLMNEPVDMPGGAAAWETASQAAVDAIRATSAANPIQVPGYEWSGAQRWDHVHPEPWITDAGPHRYEAHHYFDRDNSGKYVRSYADEVADAEARDYTATCGDAVEPSPDPTSEQTVDPTDEPTDEPTDGPTDEPTNEPTNEPTDEPTEGPTSGAVAGRLWGPDRVVTAVAVSSAGWDTSGTVVLARSDHPADALAGAPLASSLDAPLLVTPRDTLADAVAAEVARLGARRAVLLGGEAAIAPAVADGLRAVGITDVVRHAGADRAATAAAIAGALTNHPRTALLVSGEAWPDALAVSGLAARRAAAGDPWPVLLTGSTLPDATRAQLDGVEEVVIAGGTGVVPATVDRELAAMGIAVERLAGANRFATSIAAADLDLDLHGGGPLVLATGEGFADGLAAGALGGRWDATLLLVPTAAANGAQLDWVAAHPLDLVVTVGGIAAVSDATVDAVEGQLP